MQNIEVGQKWEVFHDSIRTVVAVGPEYVCYTAESTKSPVSKGPHILKKATFLSGGHLVKPSHKVYWAAIKLTPKFNVVVATFNNEDARQIYIQHNKSFIFVGVGEFEFEEGEGLCSK